MEFFGLSLHDFSLLEPVERVLVDIAQPIMPFERVLICNNGMAAAKFLSSMNLVKSTMPAGKQPLYFGMVANDDLQANSTYIQQLDYVIQVPSGPSRINYGNVDLIVELAVQYECDAVWPGWGHASENFELANALEDRGITWIGPSSGSMLQLGDKVESLLQAQKVGVPCAPWSGDHAVTATQCGLESEEQVLSECDRIGYPVMLKASNGGGGRGIRRVDRREEAVSAFHQVQAEVKDGIIFAMKCVDNCRHVEIQIIGDGQGECLALSGRDCSVQRRHQKLVEEGPPPFVDASVLGGMQSAAERLCASVKYGNAGTVEFLYHPESGKYFFLEVNCRLQVEHPVTELLFDLNLPWIQVLIAARACSLRDLPGIAAAVRSRSSPNRHVIACRIVAEDPVNRWLPSSGEIFEIRHSNTATFCYFGVSSCGSRIHQFADSQFGHAFIVSSDRAGAVAAMNRFLTELSIIGSISTNVPFMLSTVFSPSCEFARSGPPITSWLDSKFASKSSNAMSRIISNLPTTDISSSLSLLAVCVHLAMHSFQSAEKEILRWVRKGHRAPHAPTSYSERLVCPGGERVGFETARTGESTLLVSILPSRGFLLTPLSVEVEWHSASAQSACAKAIMRLKDVRAEAVPASVLVSLVSVSSTRVRAQVGKDKPWHQFEVEEDRSKILAPMNGRLVRWLVPTAAMVTAGDRVCELEAMKMVTVVVAKAAGVISHKIQEGVSFIEGDVLAALEDAQVTRNASAETPTGLMGDSAVTGLIDLLSASRTSVTPQGMVARVLNGFPDQRAMPEIKLAISKLAPNTVTELIETFVKDETRCARFIPSETVGDEASSMEVISSGSDEDLVACWRHRSCLGVRAETAMALIDSGRVSIDAIAHVMMELDMRVHKALIARAGAVLKVLDPSHAALDRLKSGTEDDGSTMENSVCLPDDPIARRRQLASEAGTFFIYDLIDMLSDSVTGLWVTSGRSMPEGPLVEAVQLVLNQEGSELVEVDSVDMGRCGMAAWMVTMKTPEAPTGRRAVFIGNDISFQIGTFSVDEDKTYLFASQLARQEGIPRIYVACNSGARLGLCAQVMKLFRVEWIDATDLSQGFQFLYLADPDYQAVKDSVITRPETHPVHGKIHIISDVLGAKNEYIGVENLVWSGAIAGESSQAYQETFTLSYVTGRTVGIGAYIARLCQRIIQKVDSPILLTGFQALNKLIGTEVYQSNDEIGGVGVMFRNGVSHLTVQSDVEGISAILKWLQFVPVTVRDPVSRFQCIADPADRLLDPFVEGGRALIDDSVNATMFDKGSFVEVQAAWARSVIAGRARIGGIPIGVIVVETRQTHYYQPADPADPHSQTVARAQAGQVWYPDSAYKTAQAIMDFNREKLPLLILANWRGFSGGQRDMFNEILKFGSYIVDALTAYAQPVFVYLPPKAELRGGAWVVVDSRINPDQIEMYADPSARGGVLEPSGTTEIKFRSAALHDLMMRTDDTARSIAKDASLTREHMKARLAEHFLTVKPTLVQVANSFADMHDTPNRMIHTGAIKGVVEWTHARKFFYKRLRERLGFPD